MSPVAMYVTNLYQAKQYTENEESTFKVFYGRTSENEQQGQYCTIPAKSTDIHLSYAIRQVAHPGALMIRIQFHPELSRVLHQCR